MTRSWLMSELDGLLRLQGELDRVLERPFDWFARSTVGRGAFPPVNIFRGDTGYTVRVEVPGLPLESLTLDANGDTLKIAGKRDAHTVPGSLHRQERWNGEFSRTVRLPKDAALERAEANYRNGVLTVTVPLREEAKPRRIAITANAS